MLDLTLFVCGSALFDSLATTQQIIILILLFSTERPIRTSLGFILGISAAYLACGIIGLAFVDRLNDMIRVFVPNLDQFADPVYYQAQLLLGAVLFIAGPVYWLVKASTKRPPVEIQLLSRVKRMTFGVALALGVVLAATSFPMAIPYVAAIEKISSAHLGLVGSWTFLVLYNLVYALPLLVPFVLFVLLRDAILPKLHLHVQRLNVVVMILMLSGFGAFLLADSLAYFWGGHPLVQTRFL